MSVDPNNAVFVVYDPPRADLPYLAVVFVPGKDDPIVTACRTAAQAEEFNLRFAATFAAQQQGQ